MFQFELTPLRNSSYEQIEATSYDFSPTKSPSRNPFFITSLNRYLGSIQTENNIQMFCVSCIRYFLSPGLVHELISHFIMYDIKKDVAKVSKIFRKVTADSLLIGIYFVCWPPGGQLGTITEILRTEYGNRCGFNNYVVNSKIFF